MRKRTINWAKMDVDPDTGCWIWTGKPNNAGYGPHREAWEQLVGPIPPKLDLDHVVCKRRLCIRPSHMELVTRSVNNLRIVRVKKPPLTDEQWALMRQMAADGCTDGEIGRAVDRAAGNIYTMRKKGKLR